MKQALTAVQVYRQDIEPDLARRQQFVKEELAAFHRMTKKWPTALELLRFAVQRQIIEFGERMAPGPNTYDVNTIRPRLTELWEQGWVSRDDKRTCSVSGKTVFVWELKDRPLGLF